MAERAGIAVRAYRLEVVRIAAVLQASPHDELHGRGARMLDCSSSWNLRATPSGDGRMVPFRCDDRLCACCAAHRTRRIRDLLEHQLAGGQRVRFLTLTQPSHPGESCADARARLARTWARFWRRLKAREAPELRGGIRRFEATFSNGAWHWHAHVMAHGAFWAQADLSAEWSRAGGGPVVDIREAFDSRELTKYVVKTASLPEVRIVEFALTTRGLRDLQPFGTWYGVELDSDEADNDDDGWFFASEDTVRDLAEGREVAAPVLERLHQSLNDARERRNRAATPPDASVSVRPSSLAAPDVSASVRSSSLAAPDVSASVPVMPPTLVLTPAIATQCPPMPRYNLPALRQWAVSVWSRVATQVADYEASAAKRRERFERSESMPRRRVRVDRSPSTLTASPTCQS